MNHYNGVLAQAAGFITDFSSGAHFPVLQGVTSLVCLNDGEMPLNEDFKHIIAKSVPRPFFYAILMKKQGIQHIQ